MRGRKKGAGLTCAPDRLPSIRIPFFLKAWSYVEPVSLRRSPSDVSGRLELRLYHNRFQLRTESARYSDGDRYFPAVAVVEHLQGCLPAVARVLLLGGGLGSLIQVMRARGYHPCCTFVEKDEAVLGWALEILGASPKLEPVCQDAESFMATNHRKFDLVFVDVFRHRRVPDFVTAPAFLRQCRDGISTEGRLALNYIVEEEQRWRAAQAAFAAVFPAHHLISARDSRILISLPPG